MTRSLPPCQFSHLAEIRPLLLDRRCSERRPPPPAGCGPCASFRPRRAQRHLRAPRPALRAMPWPEPPSPPSGSGLTAKPASSSAAARWIVASLRCCGRVLAAVRAEQLPLRQTLEESPFPLRFCLAAITLSIGKTWVC
ncbi:uncharacterized protein M6B38_364670 [Iris pallida]|uniref:Uncharacterized protein n=1 Tax=Iris pallida TaxID=29817 RepID=A0AAX6GH62_IRIPA|nr:uncharacterized protein M6B38_364670 [Iris pallida]